MMRLRSTPGGIRTHDLRFRKLDTKTDNMISANNLQQVQSSLGVIWEYHECHLLALLDAELKKVIESWDQLPKHIKQTILTLIDS